MKVDLLQKSFILKKVDGVKDHLESVKTWIDLIPTERVVFAYDPIPLRDKGTILLLMDYFQGSRNGYEMVKSFQLEDLNEKLPSEYSRYVHEYAVEVALTLLELHSKNIIHGDIDLKNILCVKQEAGGLLHKFKVTNLKPWVVETFPSD